MNKAAKTLMSSAAAIVLSASLIAGSTFALFSSESKIDIAVTSGKVEVTASIDKTSLTAYTLDQNTDTKEKAEGASGSAVFPITLGTATLGTVDGEPDLSIENFVPGNSVEFDINVENNSSIAVKYQFGTTFTDEEGILFKELDVQLYEGSEPVTLVENEPMKTNLSNWRSLAPAAADPITLHVIIDFPIESGNTAQGQTCSFNFVVSAVQANAATAEPIHVEADGTYSLNSETEFKALGDMVAMGESFEGKTVELSGDVTLAENMEPIGTFDHPFEGTLDGKNHTVTLREEVTPDDSTGDIKAGLFEYVHNSEIKNLHLKGDIALKGTINGTTAVGVIANSVYVGGIYATARFDGRSSTDIIQCTNDINIDLSGLTFVENAQVDLYVGGFTGSNDDGQIRDCIYTGTITLPAEDAIPDSVKFMASVGGFTGMGKGSGGSSGTDFTNIINVGTLPKTTVPEVSEETTAFYAVFAGGIIGQDHRQEAALKTASTTWFSLNAPIVGFCIEGEAYDGNNLDESGMKVKETFVAARFDFDTVWEMGEKYPVLR